MNYDLRWKENIVVVMDHALSTGSECTYRIKIYPMRKNKTKQNKPAIHHLLPNPRCHFRAMQFLYILSDEEQFKTHFFDCIKQTQRNERDNIILRATEQQSNTFFRPTCVDFPSPAPQCPRSLRESALRGFLHLRKILETLSVGQPVPCGKNYPVTTQWPWLGVSRFRAGFGRGFRWQLIINRLIKLIID